MLPKVVWLSELLAVMKRPSWVASITPEPIVMSPERLIKTLLWPWAVDVSSWMLLPSMLPRSEISSLLCPVTEMLWAIVIEPPRSKVYAVSAEKFKVRSWMVPLRPARPVLKNRSFEAPMSSMMRLASSKLIPWATCNQTLLCADWLLSAKESWILTWALSKLTWAFPPSPVRLRLWRSYSALEL